MAKRDYITVEELNFYINNVFLNEELLHNVPVVGEVSGCSVVGGHCNFTLKDKNSQIKVCFFNCSGRYIPHNGAQVLVRGSVDYYVKGGQISVKAYEISYFGAGLLHMQFEELKERLEKEGLFREDHKKPIPKAPKRVAVITSLKGAAVQDFITTVRRYNDIVDITVIDVRVQGDNCVSDIITALINADEYGFDVLVLARGGGSYEDLFCFNDEKLARVIYSLNTPIISAVGHETDYTLSDFVADYRAITPTAAAEIIGYSVNEIKDSILQKIKIISNFANNLMEKNITQFTEIAVEMQDCVSDILNKQYKFIFNLSNKMKLYATVQFEREKAKINHLITTLERISPLKLLKQGYFRILKDEEYVYNIKNLSKNDNIKILGFDGEIEAKIIDIRS